MNNENAYMQRTIDFKKMWLLYMERIGLIITITIFVAAISAGIYKVYQALTYEGDFYRVSSDYYITFNFDEHANSVDYYNAYTWDSILRDDPIVDGALAVLPADYSKEEIKASITGEMLGDYRILTVHSTHANPDRAEAIAAAYAESLVAFADKIDMLNTIEKWSNDECHLVVEEDLTANATLLGAVVGVVAAFFVLLFACLMDDSIYLEKDFTERFHVPFLGMLTRKQSQVYVQELKDNTNYLLKADGTYYMVSAESFDEGSQRDMVRKSDMDTAVAKIKEIAPALREYIDASGDNLNKLRNSDGAVLVLPWGDKNGRRAEKLMEFLKKQDCKIAGAVITDADDNFLKKYYFGKRK